MPRHLVGAEHREHRLRRQDPGEARDHLVLHRRAQAAGAGRIGFDPAVDEEADKLVRAEVEDRRRIARNPLLGRVRGIERPVGAETDAAFPEAQRDAVGRAEAGVVARRAGDVPIAGEDLVPEEQAAQCGLARVDRDKHVVRHRRRRTGQRRDGDEGEDQGTAQHRARGCAEAVTLSIASRSRRRGIWLQVRRNTRREGRWLERVKGIEPSS